MKDSKPIMRVRQVMKRDVDIVDGMVPVSEALNNTAKRGLCMLAVLKPSLTMTRKRAPS